MMQAKPIVLQVGMLPDHAILAVAERFTLVTLADAGAPLAEVRGVATNGKTGIDATLLARLPMLKVISCLGAGTDGVDAAATQDRGIAVKNTSHVLAGDVADIAMGLILATGRNLLVADRFVRAGAWAGGKLKLARSLGSARLGIVGLGAIGGALARRAGAFDMAVGYHTRRVVKGSPYRHFDSVLDLAAWCDFLCLCCPGGPATHHLVDATVLRALGPEGLLINVARGSVVDEAALVDALQTGTIAGAGLDVFEDEPHPHPDLLQDERTVLLPHIGSATTETRAAMATAMVNALTEVLCGGEA